MQIEYKTGNHDTGALTKFQNFVPPLYNRRLAFSGKLLNENSVSAVIIAFNEEPIIAKTLNQLYWCDEIIIIDSGSGDATVDICKSFGCKIFFHSFKGFGEQKRFGVEKARNNWILSVDADEVLSEDLIYEIRTELSRPQINYTAFAIPRNLVFTGTGFHFGKESKAPVIRLFDKRNSNWNEAIVHEKVCVNGAVKTLTQKILHYSFRDYDHFINKINLYSGLGAQKLATEKRGKPILIIALAVPFNFFKYYIIDRNFLNGFKGFIWSALCTWYHFLKHVKALQLKKEEKSRNNHRL